MSDDRTPPDVAAVELALGLLEGDERAAALRRVLAEPGFAGEVERWRRYLAPLFDLWPEAEAPPGLLARIERSIDGVPVAPARGWHWPAITGLTGAAAAALLVFALVRPQSAPLPAPQPSIAAIPAGTLVAAIAPTGKGVPVSAVYDAATSTIRLSAAEKPAAGRSAELWVIAGDGVPHSLGVLHSGESTALAVAPANRARLTAGATLALTIEPLGGSPSGKPSGPPVAAGPIARI